MPRTWVAPPPGFAPSAPAAYALRMDARIGVWTGMSVRDADGRKLGRVRRCHPWGFEVASGIFGRREWVVRYDEVLDAAAGEVRVARSDDALFELAAGALPHAWRKVWPLVGEALPSAPADGDVEGALLESEPLEGGRWPARRPVQPSPMQESCLPFRSHLRILWISLQRIGIIR
jgi:hypothetical protein